MMSSQRRLFELTSICAGYCSTIENAPHQECRDLVDSILSYLPRIYFEFFDISASEDAFIDEWEFPLGGTSSALDESQYELLRQQLLSVFGENDTYLETFEKDMKYSDSPIAESISENLCDIYQPIYDFLIEVRESEGNNMLDAYRQCKEAFDEYWSQTLCNVMRALNSLRNLE